MLAHQDIAAAIADAESPDTPLAWLTCDRHPAASVALVVVDGPDVEEVTFGALRDRSQQIAGALQDRGVGPGDRVATLMGKSVDLVATIVATWRLGAVYVPLFTAFAAPAVGSRLASADVRVVVTDATQRAKVQDGAWRVLVAGPAVREDEALDAAIDAGEPFEGDVPGDGDSPMVHMFTSGTTGPPKGVIHPRRYLAGWVSYLRTALGVRPGATYWSIADPGWAYGLYTAIVAPLVVGQPTIITRGTFDPAGTWDVLRRRGVTDFAGAPTIYRAMMASTPEDAGELALERLSSAGEPLTPDIISWSHERLRLTVHDHYGQTEVGMLAGFPHDAATVAPRPSSMGVALDGWTLTVLELGSDDPAPVGSPGRLAVDIAASPFMSFTEYAQPGAAAERFTADGRYYLTGDVVTEAADGCLAFSSRDDDVIIMAGYRIGPVDIETVLLDHPAVRECAVVAEPDQQRGEVVVAHVVLAGVQAGDELSRELQQWVKSRYAAHAYPRRVYVVDELPKTPSGKIQRAELRLRAAGAGA